MSPTLKRILLIVALLATAALIGFGLYQLFVKRAPGALITPAVPGAPGGKLPTAGERPTAVPGAPTPEVGVVLPPSAITAPTAPGPYQPVPVTKVSSDFAIYPSLNGSGAMRYHNETDGKFYQVAPDGTIKQLSDQVFYNVSNVTWAKNKDKAVIEYPDGSKIVYNFEEKKQVTLPKHWEDFSFSSDGGQIAAKSMGLSPENRWLITANDDGTGTKLIEPMGNNADRVQVSWSPSRQTVAFAQTGQALGSDRREVLFVGLNGENLKSAIVEGLDFQPQWSPTGKKLLYSVDSAQSGFKPELWITSAYGDDIGRNRQALKINTWANKCSFADDSTLFCAVPKELPQGAGMSPEVADSIYDDVYKIDLRTGTKTNIPLGSDNYHINNINFDAAHGKAFFTASNQRGVFEIKM